jgi:predicted metal-dependent peptidase
MNKLTKTESLSKISKALLLAEPYYGFFLLMLNKYWDNRIPTACVGKNGINYQLRINEEFWTSLDDAKKMGLLKHELLHIAFNHLTMHFNFSDKRLANVAMDMEINQYIDANMLPEGGITLESYPELNLDHKAGCRYYYDALRKAQKDKDEKGTSGSPGMDKLLDGLGNGDDPTNHDWEIFDDLSEAERKLVDKQTQRVLNQAKEQTVKRQGTVPREIESQIILEVVVPPKFDWKGFIRRFTGISTRVFTKKIRRKENRRFSDNPGLKIKMKQHMLLAIDTSGSVSDDELKEFMNEIHHIYKTGVDITIVQCDTEIRSIAPYKGKFELNVLGRGGTYFDPVLKYFNENLKNFTSLVYFTDGEAHASIKPRGNVLWVISERSSLNTSLPGKVIKLEL